MITPTSAAALQVTCKPARNRRLTQKGQRIGGDSCLALTIQLMHTTLLIHNLIIN